MIANLSKHWFKIVITVLLFVIVGAIVYQSMNTGPKAASYKVLKKAPDFEMTEMSGKPLRFKDTNGKVRLIYFYYTSCPDVCYPTTFFLSKVQGLLMDKNVFGDKTHILSITLDPKMDTLERLKQVSAIYKPDPSGWSFLRGDDEQAVQQLATSYGVGVVKDAKGLITHSNVIVLVDKDGNIRNYYNASDKKLTHAQVVEDMIKLTKE